MKSLRPAERRERTVRYNQQFCAATSVRSYEARFATVGFKVKYWTHVGMLRALSGVRDYGIQRRLPPQQQHPELSPPVANVIVCYDPMAQES